MKEHRAVERLKSKAGLAGICLRRNCGAMLQVGFLLLLVLAVPLQAQSGGTVPVDAALSFLTPNAAVEFHTGSMNAPAIPIQDGLLRVPSTRGVDPCSASGCAALVLPLAGSLHSQGLLDDGKSDQHIKDDKDDARTPDPTVRNSPSVDLDQHFYYKNKVEFSLDGGWLPVNIPFVFDVFMGDAYNMTSLRYTLVPVIASLRWQMNQVGGPWILRGNWDLECSGAVTFIPRGPETRYFAWIMGVRRNFVPRNGRIAPYFDGRVGLGNIDAKGPLVFCTPKGKISRSPLTWAVEFVIT